MDNIGRLFFCVVFAGIYLLATMALSDSAGKETVQQLNFSLIIGLLLFLAIKKRED